MWSEETIMENLNAIYAIIKVKKSEKPDTWSTIEHFGLENRSMSTISLSAIWMVSSIYHVKFESNACKCLGKNHRTKLLAATDTALEITQTHIAPQCPLTWGYLNL